MTIAKATIIATVNAALRGSFSGTDLDEPIQLTLNDLSRMACLLMEDTTQGLTSASYYLTYPTRALSTEQAIKSVVLTSSAGVRGKPLRSFPGGWPEYNRAMQSFTASSRGLPTHWVPHDQRIYLYPAPDGVYTSSIWYYAYAQNVDLGIEFPDDWETAVKYGTIYHKALLRGDKAQVELWQGPWLVEKERCRMSIPRESMIQGA